MSHEVSLIITAIISIFASSGFWAFISRKTRKTSAEQKMLIGLGHDRIIFLGMSYIDRKWLTEDEYENLYDYLYIPYKELGGNGSADRVIKEVTKLPIYKTPPIDNKGDISV